MTLSQNIQNCPAIIEPYIGIWSRSSVLSFYVNKIVLAERKRLQISHKIVHHNLYLMSADEHTKTTSISRQNVTNNAGDFILVFFRLFYAFLVRIIRLVQQTFVLLFFQYFYFVCWKLMYWRRHQKMSIDVEMSF